MESAINLYFNQHLNIDLSEQAMDSCGEEYYNTCIYNENIIPEPGWPKECLKDDTDFPIWQGAPAGYCFGVQTPASHICEAAYVGIPDEACAPYINDNSNHFGSCSVSVCEDFTKRVWKISGFGQLLSEQNIIPDWVWSLPLYPPLFQTLITEDNLKQTIIRHGPVAVNGFIPGHSVLIVGWRGKEWILKNSYGAYPPEQGYGYITSDLSKASVGFVKYPVIPPSSYNLDIACVDKDRDGFCNWGISSVKPKICSSLCNKEKDWDDSNTGIGALGFN